MVRPGSPHRPASSPTCSTLSLSRLAGDLWTARLPHGCAFVNFKKNITIPAITMLVGSTVGGAPRVRQGVDEPGCRTLSRALSIDGVDGSARVAVGSHACQHGIAAKSAAGRSSHGVLHRSGLTRQATRRRLTRRDAPEPVVLGLPRGGVPVAAPVARRARCAARRARRAQARRPRTARAGDGRDRRARRARVESRYPLTRGVSKAGELGRGRRARTRRGRVPGHRFRGDPPPVDLVRTQRGDRR